MRQVQETVVREKTNSKARFQAREVRGRPVILLAPLTRSPGKARKAAAVAQTYAPIDTAADARIEQQAKAEDATIHQVCEGLGLQLHQARRLSLVGATGN